MTFNRVFQTWLFLTTLFFVFSCIDLGFEYAQPYGRNNVSGIPDKWKGTYILEEDTIVISDNFINSLKDSLAFSDKDSLLIRKYKGWYYLNIKKSTRSYWTVLCLRERGQSLWVLTPEIESEDSIELKPFGMRIENNNDGSIQSFVIDPKITDWKKLLKSNFFSSYELRRVK